MLEAVARMPDTLTLNEISDRIALLVAIQEGEDAIEAGDFISLHEMKRDVMPWTIQKPGLVRLSVK